MLTCLLPVKLLKKPHERALLKSVATEVVAKQPEELGSSRMQSKKLGDAAAVELNKKTLDSKP